MLCGHTHAGRREQLQGEMTGSGNDGAVVIRSGGGLTNNARGGMPTMQLRQEVSLAERPQENLFSERRNIFKAEINASPIKQDR